jgi:hypothetical protein
MRVIHLLGLIAASAAIACAAASAPEPVSDEARLEELSREISLEIGTPAAQNVSECRTIGVGAKPCGGPWHYLVYSTRIADEDRLVALVESYNETEAELNRKEGRMSDCAFVTPPQVTLEDGVCRSASER